MGAECGGRLRLPRGAAVRRGGGCAARAAACDTAPLEAREDGAQDEEDGRAEDEHGEEGDARGGDFAVAGGLLEGVEDRGVGGGKVAAVAVREEVGARVVEGLDGEGCCGGTAGFGGVCVVGEGCLADVEGVAAADYGGGRGWGEDEEEEEEGGKERDFETRTRTAASMGRHGAGGCEGWRYWVRDAACRLLPTKGGKGDRGVRLGIKEETEKVLLYAPQRVSCWLHLIQDLRRHVTLCVACLLFSFSIIISSNNIYYFCLILPNH